MMSLMDVYESFYIRYFGIRREKIEFSHCILQVTVTQKSRDCSAHAPLSRNAKSYKVTRYFGAISVKIYGKSHEFEKQEGLCFNIYKR